MSSKSPFRRHAPQFKLQLCQGIRSGALGRRDAQKKYSLSATLIQLWLTQFDRGEPRYGTQIDIHNVVRRLDRDDVPPEPGRF